MENVRRISITGMGIALFVVLTLCLQVPVFENYYLCLGYVAMAVYCCSVGTAEGTIVGVFGVILYCLQARGQQSQEIPRKEPDLPYKTLTTRKESALV